MTRDQSYGGLIFVVSLVIAISYLVGLVTGWNVQWLIGVPVVLAVLGILGITAWIGWTMLTTPPPTPLEGDMGTSPSASATAQASEASKTEDKRP